jgi:transcriptional regulator with XRE-family HTH domain
LGLHDPDARLDANNQVRANVEALMEQYRWTQAELADRLGQSQPWLSKRLTGKTPFQIEDLDAIGDVFGLSPAQLLQPGHGKLDRRLGSERRTHAERRQIGERFGQRRTVTVRDPHTDDGGRPPHPN